MFRMGIIEESLEDKQILGKMEQYFVSQRIENVPGDECPVWHINEYHVNEEEILDLLESLKDNIKTTWYIHAFNDNTLYVVLRKQWFELSLNRDETWEEMIAYGVNCAQVERKFLEDIPLHV